MIKVICPRCKREYKVKEFNTNFLKKGVKEKNLKLLREARCTWCDYPLQGREKNK